MERLTRTGMRFISLRVLRALQQTLWMCIQLIIVIMIVVIIIVAQLVKRASAEEGATWRRAFAPACSSVF